MIFFVYVFLTSFGLGNLSFAFSRPWQRIAGEILKGMVVLVAMRLFNDTGLTMAVSGVGVMTGHSWSPLLKFQERGVIYVALGTLLVIAPLVVALAGVITLLAHFLSGRWRAGVFIAALALPILLWQVKTFDIYIIYGITVALLLTYQLLPYLDKQGNRSLKRLRFRQSLLAFLIIALALGTFFNRYVYRGFGLQVDIIRQGTDQFRVVALTFDDGPDPLYTSDILDILAEYQVPATFFVVGNHVELYPDIARRIVAEGHDIGNHTHTHRSLVPLSTQQTHFQIIRAHQAIKDVTGVTPTLFRPPRGIYSQYARDLLRELGYTMVLWDVTSQDWAEITARRIAQNVLSAVENGSIILLHDSGNLISPVGGNRINTVRALPLIIDGLQQEGYIFLTMEEMIILTGLTGEEGAE